MFKVYAEKIEFKCGKELTLNPDDIVVFVGPNNCGKSETLRAINQSLSASRLSGFQLVENIEWKTVGSKEDMLKYFDAICEKKEESEQIIYEALNFRRNKHDLERLWERKKDFFALIAPIMLKMLTTEERLSYIKGSVQNIDYEEVSITHPVQKLFLEHDEITKLIDHKIQDYFHDAFGQKLYIKNAGANLHLLYGEPDGKVISGRKNMKFKENLKVSRGIPNIQQQGDGIKCFVTILLNVFLLDYLITIIDEPEAFLHPPQARLMGKILAENRKGQLFVATHSTDLIQGFLSVDNKNVRIVRITRNGDTNDITELTPEKINELWSDPLLKHSNAIDGLFYDEIVVCEGYSDNVFYSAVFDAVASNTKAKTPDVFWMSGGGKGKITKIVKALKEVDTKVKVIVDIDALKGDDIKNIYKVLGENYIDIQQDVESIKNYMDQNSRDWNKLKKQGKEYLDDERKKKFDNLITKTKAKGLFILEVGELEGFCEIIENESRVKKERWLDNVLEKDFVKDSELDVAKGFIKHLIWDTVPKTSPEHSEDMLQST